MSCPYAVQQQEINGSDKPKDLHRVRQTQVDLWPTNEMVCICVALK